MPATKEEIGALARQLRDSHVFKEIVAAMKGNIIAAWANEHDADKREACFRDVQAVGRLEAALQAAAQNVEMDAKKEAAAVKKAAARQGT